MFKGKSPWTPERDALLLKLSAEGVEARNIAKHLPFLAHYPDGGKRAVIGRRWRLRNPRPKTHRPTPPKREPDPRSVMAAVIMSDGGTIEEAMAETGLSADAVRKSVVNARVREHRERRRLRQMEQAHASR